MACFISETISKRIFYLLTQNEYLEKITADIMKASGKKGEGKKPTLQYVNSVTSVTKMKKIRNNKPDVCF